MASAPAADLRTRDYLALPLSESHAGGYTAKKLASLELHTVGDLLRHLPRRYEAYGALTPLDGLKEGEYATICARVEHKNVSRMRTGRHRVLVTVTDGERQALISFFNQKPGWGARFYPGRTGWFSGRVRSFKSRLELTHPEVDWDDGDRFSRPLVPVYPASKDASSVRIADAVYKVLAALPELPEPLPPDLLERERLPRLAEAFRLIHAPETLQDVTRARRRFKWEEAFFLQVTFARRRRESAAAGARSRPGLADGLLDAFDQSCPFPLTAAQREVGDAIAAELAGTHPMHRLLQGEVGSGKTVVALRAMLRVIDSGGQAALLAPTEVLAHQHARSIARLLGPLGARGELGSDERATRIALLVGSQSAPARRRALDAAASGEAGIVVGTHALLSEGVRFADLGLVVIDEQHRFGVEQRETLRAKGDSPHVLVLTATPIPRTVAITVFGDLDVSTLRELPAGRRPVATSVIPLPARRAWLERAWARVREEVAAGHQAFVVCPRISPTAGEEDDDADAPEEAAESQGVPLSVTTTFDDLSASHLSEMRMAVLHGRLAAEEKDAVMSRFNAGELDVLVATTVVEVGVDVPNATVMVVLDADRFGVSQLHQLRGRVGRGSAPALCLLVTRAPIGSPAWQRVEAVASTSDGFRLAELDLHQRREGDVLGRAQAGRKRALRFLELSRDADLIRAAREAAFALVEADPELAGHPTLASALESIMDEERVGYLEKA